ncbi:MAG: cyclic nucleotide-binding domain-containing protein [Leptospirales bacterium]|nr:cyclic nucleotide-binding domain-containing protein [Leptospirales bacterium]
MNLRWFRENGISIVEFLRSSHILSHLGRQDLKALARAFTATSLAVGQKAMSQGKSGDSLYLVASGRLRATRREEDGSESVLGEICTGEIVGEGALLTDEPRYADVTAVEDSQLLQLTRGDFEKLAETHPGAMEQLQSLLARRQKEGHREKYRPVSRNLIEFLQSVPLFALLPPPLLKEIEPHLTWLHLPAGHQLMHQGDEADGLYVVMGGRLKFTSTDREDRVTREGDFARGDIIGELSILTGDNRSATVRAVRDSELVKLADVSVQRLLRDSPHVVFWLTRILAERLTRDKTLSAAKKFSVLAVIPVTANVDITEFCIDLKGSLAQFGRTNLVGWQIAEERFPLTPGFENNRQAELMVWLSEMEQSSNYLILQGSSGNMDWNERCLRQADKVLLVANALEDSKLSAVEMRYPRDDDHISAERILVLLQPERTIRANATKAFIDKRDLGRHFHVRRGSADDMKRLARGLTGNSIGLVLGGGGARGMAHIGVIRALAEHGVPIDMLGGTSAGAIMAGMFAYSQDLKALELTVRRFMVDQNPLNDYIFPFISISRGRKYSNSLMNVFGNAQLEDLIVPAFAVACNLTLSKEAVISSGPIWAALRASSSLPGIAPPLFYEGQFYVDGGLLNNVPVDAMRKMGAGKVIAIDVSASTQNEDAQYAEFMGAETVSEAPSFMRIIRNRLRGKGSRRAIPSLASILIRSTVIGSVSRVKKARADADIFARLPLDGFGLLDWKEIDKLIDIGYKYACENMEIWKGRLGLAIAPRSGG